MTLLKEIKEDFKEYLNIARLFKNEKYMLLLKKNIILKEKIVFLSLSDEVPTKLSPSVENKLILENKFRKTFFFFKYKEDSLNIDNNRIVITILKK